MVISYGGPQLSHQNQMLTANSNHSRQIQIAHSKFKSLPFCRGSRVFFRVSRVHCRGSLFYTEKWWKSVIIKRINIKIAHRVLSIGVSVLIRVYCRHATLLDCGTTIILAWINLLNKLTNSTLPSNSWPKYRRTRLLSS